MGESEVCVCFFGRLSGSSHCLETFAWNLSLVSAMIREPRLIDWLLSASPVALLILLLPHFPRPPGRVRSFTPAPREESGWLRKIWWMPSLPTYLDKQERQLDIGKNIPQLLLSLSLWSQPATS